MQTKQWETIDQPTARQAGPSVTGTAYRLPSSSSEVMTPQVRTCPYHRQELNSGVPTALRHRGKATAPLTLTPLLSLIFLCLLMLEGHRTVSHCHMGNGGQQKAQHVILLITLTPLNERLSVVPFLLCECLKRNKRGPTVSRLSTLPWLFQTDHLLKVHAAVSLLLNPLILATDHALE